MRPYDANVVPPRRARELPSLTGPIRILGMQGLGDSFHERPVLRALLDINPDVEITTSWPQVFRDMPVRCIKADSDIPYCKDNERYDAAYFGVSNGMAKPLPLTYLSDEVKTGMSFTQSMSRRLGVTPRFQRYLVPDDWSNGLSLPVNKPVMVLRPLVTRTIWHASRARNPLREAYEAVYNAIRDRFFVVSVADLAYGIETLASGHDADLVFHDGLLTFRQLLWLFSRASLVFSSPGMGMVIGLHVGTPTVGVFGGHEAANCYSDATPTPFCAVEPIHPCNCFSVAHQCDKTIDLPAAIRRVEEFADAAIAKHHAA